MWRYIPDIVELFVRIPDDAISEPAMPPGGSEDSPPDDKEGRFDKEDEEVTLWADINDVMFEVIPDVEHCKDGG